MQKYSPQMLKAFEKEYGNFADFNGTKQEYFKLVKAFSHGWRAGQSFHQKLSMMAENVREKFNPYDLNEVARIDEIIKRNRAK